MKKLLAVMILCLSMSACGSDMTINGKTYGTYGLLNRDEVRDDKVQYKTIGGNIFWGIVGFETVIAPIYFFGFSMYEPVGMK